MYSFFFHLKNIQYFFSLKIRCIRIQPERVKNQSEIDLDLKHSKTTPKIGVDPGKIGLSDPMQKFNFYQRKFSFFIHVYYNNIAGE